MSLSFINQWDRLLISLIFSLPLCLPTAQAQGLTPNDLFKAVKGTVEQQIDQVQANMLPIYRENIKEVKPHHYEVKKAFVDQQLLVIMPLLRQIRLIPTYEDEKTGEKKEAVQGFKLFGIKPNTLFELLGLKSKDILYRVSGESFTRLDQGPQLVEKAKKKDLIDIDIKRDQQVIKLFYRIVP